PCGIATAGWRGCWSNQARLTRSKWPATLRAPESWRLPAPITPVRRRARAAVAFDRAANLYRRSLELRPLSGPEGRQLRATLGDALADAGRGAEAAPVYLAAAEGAEGVEKLELCRRAADQFLLSGCTREGLGVLSTLLAAVGMRLPRGRRRAILAMLLERV